MPTSKSINSRQLAAAVKAWRRLSLWLRLPIYIFLVLAVLGGGMYGVAEWYIHKHHKEPLVVGTTFISSYAEYYGLDPHYALQQILGDLQIKQVRLVSYWDEIEPTPGHYDFSNLDWQFALAQQYGAKVSLSIGLRQPRWPECHPPSWVNNEPAATWQPQLQSFMGAVIAHYKNNPQLQSYQLENEYFLGAFGQCSQFGSSRQRLVGEFNYVKTHDSQHPVIMSLANNYLGIPAGQPRPDQFGVSVYKRVFDYTVTHRYFEYPFPPWYYAARSGLTEIFTGKASMLHELQAEPWGPVGIKDMSLAEQAKSMNATLLKQRIKYGEDAGYRTIDLWGAEWWLWRKDAMHDPSEWNVVKQAVQQATQQQ